jgi:hypothetical protein
VCSWRPWRCEAPPDPERAARNVQGDDRSLLDYFTAEVLPSLGRRRPTFS